jgi:hypothetical protein
VKKQEVVILFFKDLHKLSNEAFSTFKWALAAVAGALTTGLTLALES